MEVILDANFIISCIRNRIDFLPQLKELGFKVAVPREVLQEMKDLRVKDGLSHEDRIAVKVALEMIERNKIKKMTLGKGRVDDFLISKGKEGVYIASLDREIKRKVPNRVVIRSSKDKIEIERD